MKILVLKLPRKVASGLKFCVRFRRRGSRRVKTERVFSNEKNMYIYVCVSLTRKTPKNFPLLIRFIRPPKNARKSFHPLSSSSSSSSSSSDASNKTGRKTIKKRFLLLRQKWLRSTRRRSHLGVLRVGGAFKRRLEGGGRKTV